VAPRVESFDVGTLGLTSGEGRTLELEVPVEELTFGGQTYGAGGYADARLDVSHTTTGHALRLRFAVELHGPCTRCLEDAGAPVEVDAREVDQREGAGGAQPERRSGEHRTDDVFEVVSPYVDEAGAIDLRAWARDALALALPARILCDEGCRGLCPRCGANLNAEPEHAHEPEPDPRWAKLSELKLKLDE
jgi:uncharacterized protein